MSEPFIGEIRLFAGQFAPQGWAFCDGSELPIAQNDALFTLLQTQYGGDGQQTFALPDLRGRVPLHTNQGAGPRPFLLGQPGGSETVAVTAQTMGAHSHALPASQDRATPAYAQGGAGAFANTGGAPVYGLSGSGGTTALRADTIARVGGGQPHNNMAPYLGLNFIIALTGIYPSYG
ncbi:phage tail protein [Duganella vulcania]|uniref:Phage tail protein n=1 Tax=Duganella vulcania TaxID=2692166 RepID=A0A845GLD4_9BURK|nr:tail fiber protein [Duganella vulcania]MYM95094.1 phage tail protein [Duganella vulcania]